MAIANLAVADVERCGVPTVQCRELADRANHALAAIQESDPESQARAWRDLQEGLLRDRSLPYEFHRLLFQRVYAGRDVARDGPPPAWFPSEADRTGSNVGQWMREMGTAEYAAFHRASVEHRDEFWGALLKKVRIRFRRPPLRIRHPLTEITRPEWLPGAELNMVESCFLADPKKVAILFGHEGSSDVRAVRYGDLQRLAFRVARGLDRTGLGPDDRVVLYLPMTPESVAIYLGIVASGRAAVGVADASAAPDLAKRIQISGAKAVFAIDAYLRDGKELRVYDKVKEARAPRTIVLPPEGTRNAPSALREGDLAWEAFLDADPTYEPVARAASDPTNILFSSGTTKDPKAIVWTQTTPIKCVTDAYLHQDVRADDVLAWPTSFGWMMGPWLAYASLVLGATMALYNGSPLTRAFGEFVQRARVTMLGVVPKLVRSWKSNRTMEGLDWSRIRRFSSTGETSDPDEMLYLMWLAGYKPIIEYCGGTEIGGGYITGTMVQPASPATFTTPSCGLDFYLLDEQGRPTDRGEVGLVPPSIGLSNDLLNYDHYKEYFEGFPRGPKGEALRRHGDQVERLGRGYFRHHGRIDDMVNLNGVKTSVEELRAAIAHHPLVYDTKPISVDVEGKGQRVLVVYAIPKDPARLRDAVLRAALRTEFAQAIRARLNPLLAQVHDVVLVAELPQAGPGKTRTQKEFAKDYQARVGKETPAASARR